jgi:hypothetical protein
MDQCNETHRADEITNRRGFLRHFFVYALCLAEEVMGNPQMRLNDLDQMPEEVMRSVTPVLNPKFPWFLHENQILVKRNGQGCWETIYEMEGMDAHIFTYFGSGMTIDAISSRIKSTYALEAHAAYERVRELFLLLSKHMICLPEQPHDLNEPI